MPTDISVLDLLALCWFFVCWYSISWLSRHYKSKKTTTLKSISRCYRNQWMLNMLKRENRMPDVALLGHLMRSVSFFASTSLIVLASLIAVFSAVDDAIKIINDIPYAQHVSPSFWKLKLLLLVVIFAFVFFKLVWSIRQYNSTIIMIGAAADIFYSKDELTSYAKSLGVVLHRATLHFVEGMRGFEFALAALAWFIHPVTFMLATIIVTLVIYRREFASRTMKAMEDE